MKKPKVNARKRRIRIPKQYRDVNPDDITCEEFRESIAEIFELYQQNRLPRWARDMFEEMLAIARADYRKPN